MRSNLGTGPVIGAPRRRWWGAAALTAAALVGACGAEGGRGEYVQDADTGAASPATAPDMSTAERIGVDSTTGIGGRTGEPGVAGDTMGSRGRAAGVPPAAVPGAPPR